MGRKAPTGKSKRSPRKAERPSAPEPALPGVNPAAPSHADPDESVPFPIVGVGASAGGIEAFTQLFHAVPVDTGMAFIVIQHLDPTHESLLTAILGRATRMPVSEIVNNTAVEPNRVYVIPPGRVRGGRSGSLAQ